MTRQIAVPEIPTDTATSHAPRVVHRLLDAGYRLPDELRDDILALGQAAVPALLEIVEDAVSKSPVGGWAPAHAAQLLGGLHATAAIETMLRVLAGADANDLLLHDKIIEALLAIGAAATEPLIRAFANNTDPTFRYSISTVLAEWQTHNDRIFEILIDQLRREPSYSASNLAIYGDPRAVPHLLEALDQYTIVESESPLANHALVELRAAIEELGGTLTTEQQLKCRRGRERAEVFSRKLDAMLEAHRREVIVAPAGRNERVMPAAPARRERRPGRNEPCWCGSARKYKKCHLATDENAHHGSR
jgi:uncharacterized protein YecA (UPF0149 family)